MKQFLFIFVIFFQQCQMDIGHPLPLITYLHKPVQRILKYRLLLEVANKLEVCLASLALTVVIITKLMRVISKCPLAFLPCGSVYLLLCCKYNLQVPIYDIFFEMASVVSRCTLHLVLTFKQALLLIYSMHSFSLLMSLLHFFLLL